MLKEALCAALGKEESTQNQMELHLLFSIAVLASWCLLAFHPFGDVGSHSGSFILYAQV